ncbi:hypothetical protein [Streptomyces humi]|uniref:hypothetical protein n=1 Tax=Streptomyces humi TaxID=1428620 RepID=UPI0006288B79|nr:hypothetical protein [Streptomyces humi]
MDLEGIAALTAAAVAVVGIPASLVMGRWQLKGALRGAEETARAGQAQADASYRAALDGARAQGHNDHLQWRRGVQREAYAAFLQSVLSYTDGAKNDLSRASGQEETLACIAALRGLETDMSHRGWVVRLEGPDDVAQAAVTLRHSATLLALVYEQHARRMAAMHEIDARAHVHRREVTRIWELIPVATGFWRTIGTPEMEAGSEAVLQELRDLFSTCELPGGMLATLCQPSERAPVDVPTFDEAITGFIHAARIALHPAEPTAP